MIGKDNVNLVIQAVFTEEEEKFTSLVSEVAGKINALLQKISSCFDCLLFNKKTNEILEHDEADSINVEEELEIRSEKPKTRRKKKKCLIIIVNLY